MTLRHSGAVVEALVEAMTIEDLRHLVAIFDARRHVPTERAIEIADRLAAILSAQPLDSELGPIANHPTIGFLRRHWPERVA